jgi:hypothetical protein
MNLVVGCPCKDRAWVLPEWFDALYGQGIELEVICLVSASEDGTEAMLAEEGATVIMDDRPGRNTTEIDGHLWGSGATYQYMASLRNQLTDEAIARDADYFFSLDSDIILPPGGLKQLLDYAADHPGVVSPAVNMTVGSTAWNTMDWTDKQFPTMAIRPQHEPRSGPADVIMAAMLLDRTGMECLWQPHGQGEDVGFCIDAHLKQVPRWWFPEVRCQHLMRRS